MFFIFRVVRLNFVLSFLCISFVSSQNLIENPSFEVHRNCPNYLGSFSEDLLNWATPTQGTTDYFHECNKGIMGIPNNFNGSQKVKEGKAYAGFYMYAPNDYREYIEVQLKKKLEKDRVYQLIFYVSLAENSDVSVYNFGVLFAANKINLPFKKVVSRYQLSKIEDNFFNALEVHQKKGFQDTSNWQKVTIDVVAKGFENYMSIGNFNSNAATQKSKTKMRTHVRGAYYYIDMVSLVEKGAVYALNETYVFENVLFDFDEFKLDTSSKMAIEKVYAYLHGDDSLAIEIRGHADAIGYDAYNLKLSQKRAQVVADYLISLGIEENRVRVHAYGSDKPFIDNANEIERYRNRRVEFVIKKDN